jgi:hypothetical protein
MLQDNGRLFGPAASVSDILLLDESVNVRNLRGNELLNSKI